MSDEPQFNKHQDPRYERPNTRWRCGRAAAWGAPCSNGPNPDGTCGAQPGGQRCIPRPSLRVLRGRATFLVAVATVLFLAVGFHFGVKRTGTAKSLTADPGPLSATHANFTENQGCATCHSAHDAGIGELLRAAFTPHDMTGKCVDCHTFGGKERLAHNTTFPNRTNVSETSCTMCHTEHHGAKASLTSMTDAQCQHCHQVKFESFTRGHPPFPTNFPHVARSGIQFDHAEHFGKHFIKPENQERAPANCQECHKVSAGIREVRTAGFDQACARCHAQQVRSGAFHALTFPESNTNANAIVPPTGATALMRFLLGPTNDPAAYSARARPFLQSLTSGPAAMAGLLSRALATPASSNLLAGLNREFVSQPALLWSRGETVSLDSAVAETGWSWFDADVSNPALQYIPLTHADPVARAWLESVAGLVARSTNADERQRALALRNELMHPGTGVGHCLKCHTVSETDPAGRQQPEMVWRYRGGQLGAHTTFSHGTHAGVASCVGCHVQATGTNFAAQFIPFEAKEAVSNFKPLTTAICQRCHAQAKVRDDCFLCHRYHESPGLRRSVLTAK